MFQGKKTAGSSKPQTKVVSQFVRVTKSNRRSRRRHKRKTNDSSTFGQAMETIDHHSSLERTPAVVDQFEKTDQDFDIPEVPPLVCGDVGPSNRFDVGLNKITRVLERYDPNDKQSIPPYIWIIVSRDSSPAHMISHLPILAQLKSIPLLAIVGSQSQKRLGDLVSVKRTLVLGLKNNHDSSSGSLDELSFGPIEALKSIGPVMAPWLLVPNDNDFAQNSTKQSLYNYKSARDATQKRTFLPSVWTLKELSQADKNPTPYSNSSSKIHYIPTTSLSTEFPSSQPSNLKSVRRSQKKNKN